MMIRLLNFEILKVSWQFLLSRLILLTLNLWKEVQSKVIAQRQFNLKDSSLNLKQCEFTKFCPLDITDLQTCSSRSI